MSNPTLEAPRGVTPPKPEKPGIAAALKKIFSKTEEADEAKIIALCLQEYRLAEIDAELELPGGTANRVHAKFIRLLRDMYRELDTG